MNQLRLTNLALENHPPRVLVHRLVSLIKYDAQFHAMSTACHDSVDAFPYRHRQRLLDQGMFASRCARDCLLHMEPIRCRVVDRINATIAKDLRQ